MALTGTNYFSTKKLLGIDDTSSNYLVYCPIAYESQEDNWLLDIELYSEEFRADLVSMWMSEMGIPQTPGLRKGFKSYRKFFNAKELPYDDAALVEFRQRRGKAPIQILKYDIHVHAYPFCTYGLLLIKAIIASDCF